MTGSRYPDRIATQFIRALTLILLLVPAHADKKENSIRFATDQVVDNVDRYFNDLRVGFNIAHHIWDSLIYRDPATGGYRGLLATSWRWIDDTTIEFELRKGVRFHNGAAFDADDVVATLNYVTNPASKIVAQTSVAWIDHVEKLDPYRIRIVTKHPFSTALEYTAAYLIIYPHEYYARVGPLGMNERPVGTGPYRVIEHSRGKYIRMERNRDYFIDSPKHQPEIDKFEIRFIPDPQTQIAEVLVGGVDMIWNVAADQAQQLRAIPALQVVPSDTERIAFLHLNGTDRTPAPPLRDARVRKAIMHAIDRATMLETLVGTGGRLLHTLCHPLQFGCTDGAAPRYSYDPPKAKQLLAEAGYPDGFELDLYAYRDRSQTEAIIGYLRAVRITANLRFLQVPAARDARRAGKVAMDHWTWGPPIQDVSAMTSVFFAGYPDDMNRDSDVQTLLRRGDSSLDEATRKDSYARALALIQERAYALPLAQIGALESGVAVTDPDVLASLPAARFSIGAMLLPRSAKASTMKNNDLFTGPLKGVGDTLQHDIDTRPQASLDPDARATLMGAGASNLRFSSRFLRDANSGFVLTGIINRMDRAYKTVDHQKHTLTCGEIRLLYRFTYDIHISSGEIKSRLPFTASVVLNGKNPDDPISCGEIAKRWQEAGRKSSVSELIAYLKSGTGPLQYVTPSHVDRLEVNIQLFRLPASEKPHFGGYAEYLLRVFRLTTPGGIFEPVKMENQIDRVRLMADPALLTSFKKWLFTSSNIWDLDHGLLDVPDTYLTKVAVSVSPGGASRSQNEPYSGLGITDQEVKQALKQYEAGGERLQTIKSVEGFYKRLNNVTCTGCHQTRAIAGFQFPGADLKTEPPNNAVHVPGSPHFFGDLPRRRAIIDAFANGGKLDFSRGFSDRPEDRFKQALSGTELFDGWGAACYSGPDPSFANWTCKTGLQCKVLNKSPRNPGMGTCVSSTLAQIGDPAEFGQVTETAFGNDVYKRLVPPGPADPNHYVTPSAPPGLRAAHQGFKRDDLTGGFPAGMLLKPDCTGLPTEAACGRLATSGFNDCITHHPFPYCLEQHSAKAGLRACTSATPCREDYICTAPHDATKFGTCIPPYFVFQFRVDGHPGSFTAAHPVP
jgi:peptide/nickel transport system substrate-binding protein